MVFKMAKDTSEHVSGCLQLALLFEFSAYPKPGNVHRTADFGGTRYEHFLASTVAVAPSFRTAAEQGVLVSTHKLSLNRVEVGKIIRDAVKDVASWQHGGNTLLGSIILLTPIAVSAGLTLGQGKSSISGFRRNLRSIVESTTPEDAAILYDAINIAKPGGLGKAPQLDVTDAVSRQRILDEGISLYDIFKISAPWDSISSEWVNNYHITFDIGYPFLVRQLEATRDTNAATVNTFLKILSEVPDTLVARKAGLDKAKEVSTEAQRVLEIGGLATLEGKKSLQQFDQKLRDPAHRLNPGATADLTSAALTLAILNGYRP
jgi:triphosphoribosyl-dephospho-CoA synthase